MKAYFISGLGADKRAFDKIVLPARFEQVHLEWIAPQATECLTQYAKRFAQQINGAEPFILVGLSFGGMLATEISKILPPQQLVLISSASSRSELPLLYRIAGKLRLEKILPYKRIIKKPGKIANWLFGPFDEHTQQLVHSYIKATEPQFMQWAIGQISRWKNKEKPANLLQIHGSEDKLLWAGYSKAGFVMSGGGHLCLQSHAAVINQLLKNQLV
ncbi:Pimeloyl-ACP methyl ester carboxylesterase [Filimonas lacunae]|uniref:Pimeloyl-ACP methyl ester carboxylesterase n=1 Tax=Filimonas lacunae TaxID=477680 RepID=A0A173MQX4_9BACT|nr:alpha/beta hydrolase [Filimonas lacunae]BAV10075.1 hypothetical protein FLA_6130 [Filimonas lacunae]SIS83615.1 Pimeloyl-ACP methyl ester carboxylesterase [Filimonas lacunae]